MSSSEPSEIRDLDSAREYVRFNQKRLDRSRGVADEVRRKIQDDLNEIRHQIEDDDFGAAKDKIDEVRGFIDRELEGKQKSTLREYAESIGLAILFALFLRAFVIEAFKIPTGSMKPTLLVGDHLFVNKFIYGIRVPFTEHYVTRFNQPARGEVVVFKFPTEEAQQYIAKQPHARRDCIDSKTLHQGKDFIKRIVGTEGDTVELRDNKLYINNSPVERYKLEQKVTGEHLYPHVFTEVEELNGHKYTIRYRGQFENFGPIKVKPNHVFVMGDNRDNSSDGRCWGQVPVENIKGRAMIIWLSKTDEQWRFDRIGKVIH